MSTIICAKCGGLTNTAVSEWLDPIRKDKKAHYCYLRWENNKWVKGCSYDKADPYTKPTLEKYLKEKDRT